MSPAISALIPAAGISARMGTDKALLNTAGGSSFIWHLLEGFTAFGCEPVILVVNERFPAVKGHDKKTVPVLNRHPEKGRTYSIWLGLQQVPPRNACFIQNTDNPYLDPGLLNCLADSLLPESYSVPVFNGKSGHPILLGKSIVNRLRELENEFDFRSELSKCQRIEVPWHDNRILLNINTPDDYDEFISAGRAFDKKM